MLAQLATKSKRVEPSRATIEPSRASYRATSISSSPKHTLEECVMPRRYFHKVGPPAEDGKGQGNNKKEDDKEEEFPEVRDCFMIYGG